MDRNTDMEMQAFFGDRFTATETKTRFEVMLDHFAKKFSITEDKAKEAYEKVYSLYQEGKVEKFTGYFAALCKSASTKEYTPEQTKRYIDYNIRQRKDPQLEDFIRKYEAGERRVFAPNFGITKKEHNDLAYQTALIELEARRRTDASPSKSMDKAMDSH